MLIKNFDFPGVTGQSYIDNLEAKKCSKIVSVLKLYLQYNTSVSTSEEYLATLLRVLENHPKMSHNKNYISITLFTLFALLILLTYSFYSLYSHLFTVTLMLPRPGGRPGAKCLLQLLLLPPLFYF